MSVCELIHDETARFDPRRLERLCVEIGEDRAEHQAAEALDRINRALKGIERLGETQHRARLMARLAELIEASDKIGMSTLGRVARDVRYCARKADPNALAATLCRLERVGDRSIHAIFDLEGQHV
ncbi:MAG: hypothetical protein AAFN09_11875 [Pseudomonadota bacterium]